MEAVYSSKTFPTRATQHHVPEDGIPHTSNSKVSGIITSLLFGYSVPYQQRQN
jgi:hypothetical protein